LKSLPHRLLPFCILAAALVSASAQTLPQTDPPATAAPRSVRTARITAIDSAIVLDGVLDEPAWAAAPNIGELIQRIPHTGEAPSQRTEVTLLRDADYLYIGVVCHDSEPRRIAATQMARDASLTSDDRITIVLDTFRDQNNAFYFSTNPSGALVDGLVFTNGQTNAEWDGIWMVRTRRHNAGWTAEFAIPFRTLGFPAGETAWGFNIARNIQRNLEEDRWTGALRQIQFFQVSEAGEITNLEGATQGIGLDLRPFIAGRWLHTNSTGADVFVGKPGFDLFYNITPSIKLSATANTDFGETEVDARQINLSRFSLLFPEKRTFFLQDVGVFNFGGNGPAPSPGVPASGADIFPFFSRQIGLVNGVEVPIDVGVKLTGKVGRTDFGLLNVRTREFGALPASNLLVARVRRNFLQQSYVGAIFTSGAPSSPRSSHTVGADMRLGTSHFLGKARNLVVNLYALRSINEGIRGKDWSWGFSALYPNDRYDVQVTVREIQDNFRPAIGFVQRRNVRMFRVGTSFNPRPKDFLNIQQMFHDVYFTRFTRLDNGETESMYLYATLVDWHFNTGDSMHSVLDIDYSYERLFAPFVISPGVVLPPGIYEFTRFRNNFTSAPQRRLSASFNYSFGEYWSGTAQILTTGLTYKMPPRFSIALNTNQTFARLPQGNFVARIISSQVSYSVSPLLTFSNLVQFDNLSRNVGWQSRMRWTLRPGNDLFFVYGQGWLQENTGGYNFFAQESKISTKLQYTFRF
jgi:hypothetical protein